MNKCKVEQCNKPRRRYGFCPTHASRFYRHGDPLIAKLNHGVGDTFEDKFWSRVEKTDACWNWKGSIRKGWGGYGDVRFQGKHQFAHRVSYFLTHGRFPEKDLLHSCDNPRCVNPFHLKEGSHQENMADMRNKGRQAKGILKHSAKLDEAKVRDIRTSDLTRTQLAAKYGVDYKTIDKVQKRITWVHIH